MVMNTVLKFQPPHNCYRLESARRAAYIIDGEAYFRALYESFQLAQRSIFIVGWDLHSDLRLVRGNEGEGRAAALKVFLGELVAANSQLDIYILNWDFAMIYALEREFFPRYKFEWQTHQRIHFCLDGHHPLGGSQHQKFVVVDDAVAFAGGFDLGKWRWDTPAHDPDNEYRVDPDGKPYPPFHDVQMAVDGAAAAALGRLARERWRRACGKKVKRHAGTGSADPWPASVEPEFEQVEVAVARTLPAYQKQPAVREVEQLYLDSITAARRWIYIENQYLSSHRIGEALKQRLAETDGPEVVIVLPEKTGGWLEQHTMDILRGRVLKGIRDADRHGRLRTYYPRISTDPHCALMVHAKVMVVDNGVMRVGSSNLSNRSMGLDSECDLAIAAAADEKEIRASIARFRNQLLAEHLDVETADVAAGIANTGSLIATIENLRRGSRTLVTLSGDVPPEVDQVVPEAELLDPEQPVAPEELLDHIVEPGQQPSAYRHLLKAVLLIAGVLLIAALWRWTPIREWVDVESVQRAGKWTRRQPFTPLLMAAAYLLAGVTAFPVTLLIIATVIVFGPGWGMVYALAGAEFSALVVFGIGRFLGRDTVRRFAGSLFNRLSRKLARSGVMAIIALRVVPVAPFSVINLIAGVSEMRLRDFALGSLVGILPGTIAIVLLADRLTYAVKGPDLTSITVLAITIAVVAGGLVGLRRWVKRKRIKRSARDTD
jgi:phosphatidylserine/phosphatidylglycerophosphate/cardiolipin synthase-like enzyme/uncharacterized membrane protein YdjX (TVP38/TMEM64 family)